VGRHGHGDGPGRAPAPQTESRLGQFTELIATAIANAEARSRAARLAEEQAALRRVATLVAREAPPTQVFEKVAEELATVLGDAECALWRDEGDGTAAAVALWGGGISAAFRLGERVPVDGESLTAVVIREGRPRRVDDISEAPGAIAKRGRTIGGRAAVACPILVRGRTWGALGVARYTTEPFAPETETRIARFAELVATAVANADTRAEMERLADEQAALRRVATLVAHESPPGQVLAAVAEEVGRLLGVEDTTIFRYEGDWTAIVVADRGERDVPCRSAAACRYRERARLRWCGARARGPGRRLLGRHRAARGLHARRRHRLHRRQPDRGRRSALGRHDRRDADRRADACRHRVAHRGVHRARRHCHLEHAGTLDLAASRARWSPPETRRGGASCATSTTARSSGSFTQS
jgi:GAF domain-containing protein